MGLLFSRSQLPDESSLLEMTELTDKWALALLCFLFLLRGPSQSSCASRMVATCRTKNLMPAQAIMASPNRQLFGLSQ